MQGDEALDATEDGSRNMTCPRDGARLENRPYEADIMVDSCGRCDGVWLDKGELERIQETVEHDYRHEFEHVPESTVQAYTVARSDPNKAGLTCPRCGAEMTQREHGYCSQIYIDVCASCQGVWLDAGELKALEVFFERSRADTREIRQSFWRSLHDLVFRGIVPD